MLAVVAHHGIALWGHLHRGKVLTRVGRLVEIALSERLAVHPDHSPMNFEGVAGQADDPLNVVRRARERRAEDNHLRSEERRVGKECRARWWTWDVQKKAWKV